MSELHKGTSRHPCIELTLERGAHHRAPQRTGQTIQTIQTIRHRVDSRRHPLRHPTPYMTKNDENMTKMKTKWRRNDDLEARSADGEELGCEPSQADSDTDNRHKAADGAP